VGVQEVRWETGGTEQAEDYTFIYGKGNEDHQLGKGFFNNKRIISAIIRVEFVWVWMSYVFLRGHWFNIIVLNVHGLCEDKSNDVKDSFCEELVPVFDQFPLFGWLVV
jgi:hypothetical protein